jgi:uncharacterized membrane protein YfcA
MYVNSNINIRTGGLGCLAFFALFAVGGYYLYQYFSLIALWAVPVLLVLALIINWRSVADTGKNFLRLLERNPLAGIAVGILSVIFFPIFAFYLFVKALAYNKLNTIQQQFGNPLFGSQSTPNDQFVEYEEVESTPKRQIKQDEPIDLEIYPDEEPK